MARLLVLRRSDGVILHSSIDRLPEWLNPGDCLVMNDTKVARCRVSGVTPVSRAAEFMAVTTLCRTPDVWEMDAMVCPGRRFRPGSQVRIGGAPDAAALVVDVLATTEIGRRLRVSAAEGAGPLDEVIETMAEVPLPPYIHNSSIPSERYQTCFAREAGSVAAPTAGLHFTPELFARLSRAGIGTAFLTLHVGPGTFRPVTRRELDAGRLHPEVYRLPSEAAASVTCARAAGRRVVAVGTTVCRTLEHIAAKFGEVRADAGATDLFIREGFSFRAVDALLTNFHLPRTSLLMLVCALAGRSLVREAYEAAIGGDYRFYSFGDAMLVL